MRVPYQWLKEFVKIKDSPEELAQKLTMIGLEVEAMESAEGEPVFDIKVTSNRGDCLSLVGIAREIAAISAGQVKVPRPKLDEQGTPIDELVAVKVEDPDLCPRYSARLITDAKVGPSPDWAQRRLIQCGARPINNVVDATNLVMLELGQPLHAFDLALLRKSQIVVRKARAGETIITIDGVSRDLTEDMLVIADAERPVAIAGVMGGANSEVVETTKSILLESAHFDARSVRRTARALGMSSEASYRFERIVDPAGTVKALDRVAELIAEWSGGKVAPGVLDELSHPLTEAEIQLRPARVNDILGVDISAGQMREFLERLQLRVEVQGENQFRVVVPTFRADLKLEIDLIEEIARVLGYDQIPTIMPQTPMVPGRQSTELGWEDRARQVMVACGLCETVSYSLTGPQFADLLCLPSDHPQRQTLKIKNPKTEDYNQVRTTLLGDLLFALANNARRGINDVHIFELGRIFVPAGEQVAPDPKRGPRSPRPESVVVERKALGAAIMGVNWTSDWNTDRETVYGERSRTMQADFFALKGMVEELAREFGIEELEFLPSEHPSLHLGRTASIQLGDVELGILGEVHPDVRRNYDLPQPAYLLELDFSVLMAEAGAERRYSSVSRFPPMVRDLALMLAEEIPAQRVRQVILSAGGDLLEQVKLFDLYQGEQIPAGQKSLAYSITFQAAQRTLTDQEVEAAMEQIRKAVTEELEAEVRQ